MSDYEMADMKVFFDEFDKKQLVERARILRHSTKHIYRYILKANGLVEKERD